MPALVALGQAAGGRWQRGATFAAAAVMVLASMLLAVLALQGLAAGA